MSRQIKSTLPVVLLISFSLPAAAGNSPAARTALTSAARDKRVSAKQAAFQDAM
jgi:hypothetical protein